MSPRDSAAWDGAPTLAHGTYASPATSSLAQHTANVPTLLHAAPRRLRVPRARATQAAAGHPHARHDDARQHKRSSSRNRTRASLQLLRRRFRQPPQQPREREDRFLAHHRLSSTNSPVRQEWVDGASVLSLIGGSADRSRVRAQGGGEAGRVTSLWHWLAIPVSRSIKGKGNEDLYRVSRLGHFQGHSAEWRERKVRISE